MWWILCLGEEEFLFKRSVEEEREEKLDGRFIIIIIIIVMGASVPCPGYLGEIRSAKGDMGR
jgi:hypothetical protein